MMKVGGEQKRKELTQMFGAMNISTTKQRTYTKEENNVIKHGDIGQGENLAGAKGRR